MLGSLRALLEFQNFPWHFSSHREDFSLTFGLLTFIFLFPVRYYNWTTAAPLLLAMQAFQKPLPKVSFNERDKGTESEGPIPQGRGLGILILV